MPTIADEQPLRRLARPAAPPAPLDEEEPTIEASTVDAASLAKPGSGARAQPRPPARPPAPKAPGSPSGAFVVKNVPVPTRPPSVRSMRVPATARVPENLGETMETSHNAFDSLGVQRNAAPTSGPQTNPSHESTQYLISSVMPHPLAKPAVAPAPPEPESKPVVSMAPVPAARPVPPPPRALIAVVVAIGLLLSAAIVYVLLK